MNNLSNQLLGNFFNEHKKMIDDTEHGITKEMLIDRAINSLKNESNTSEMDSLIKSVDFPEISFNFSGDDIVLPSLNTNGTLSVNPSSYYQEAYTDWAMKFYEKSFNLLLEDTTFEVQIIETSEYYESDEDDEEDSEWEDLPMFEAYIEDTTTGESVSETTGRYCELKSVIEELSYEVDEVLQKKALFAEPSEEDRENAVKELNKSKDLDYK